MYMIGKGVSARPALPLSWEGMSRLGAGDLCPFWKGVKGVRKQMGNGEGASAGLQC